MRRFATITITVLFLSCSKAKISNETYFTFTAEGHLFEEDTYSISADTGSGIGALLLPSSSQPANQPAGYSLKLWSQGNSYKLNIFIQTDSLEVTDQTITNTTAVSYIRSYFVFNNIVYSPLNAGDFIKINLTNIKDGKVSGTFSALLHQFNGINTAGSKMAITDGTFGNITVIK